MLIVKDVESGESVEVRGLDTKRALLAVFLREVLYKSAPEKVTAEVIEKHFPEYQQSIRRIKDVGEDGSLRYYTQLWRFCVEEDWVQGQPAPARYRRRAKRAVNQ